MRHKKSATVLVYTLVLTVLSVFMATVALNVASELSSRYESSKYDSVIFSRIKEYANISMKFARSVNQNGGGFKDILSCPTNITLSWNTLKVTGINSVISYLSGNILCSANGVYSGEDLKIFFDANYNDITLASLGNFTVFVNSGTLNATFSNSDLTRITLNAWYLSADGIDDNFNSDNYRYSSTGSISYPNIYMDDDDMARKKKYGYIIQNTGLNNIFWSNTKMEKYILKNSNNLSQTGVSLLWSVSSGALYLDVDNPFQIKVYEIEKASYDSINEIRILNSYIWWEQNASIWYLQNNGSLSWSINSGTRFFDFQNKDYAIFIDNKNASGTLLYNFTLRDVLNNKEVYFVPLDDSKNGVFSYFGSYLIMWDDGRIFWDTREIFWKK